MAEPRKPRKPLGGMTPVPQPGRHVADTSVEDALAQCDRIRESIAGADEDIQDKAGDFFASVDESVTSVRETISRLERVTPKQQRALDNWEEGVNKWLHADDGRRGDRESYRDDADFN